MLQGFADPFKADFQGKLAFVIRVELKSSSTWLILVESLPFFFNFKECSLFNGSSCRNFKERVCDIS